jgi:serine/threonine protein kinase
VGAADLDELQFGRYRLRERLGTGGMAEVWLAHDARGRDVVVKRILPHLVADADFIKMFLREAQISMRLRHPNIVEVHESGSVAGHYFLAMAYLRGRDLRTVQRTTAGPMPLPLAAFVMHEVLRALDYTHHLSDGGKPLQLVHRDVSPANIMLGFDGRVTLLDFGVAKAAADSVDLTTTGTLRGKIPYMAPEQMTGKKLDHRVDIFACGVVLHELLTGRRLFKGDTDMDSIELVRSGPVQLPSRLNPRVTEALDGICMKALARNVKDRYGTANEMALDLNAIVVAEKVNAAMLATFMRQTFPSADGSGGGGTTPRRHDFSQSTMKVKATTLLSRRAAITEKIGDATYEEFIAEIAEELPTFKKTLLPSTQIPVGEFLRFNDMLVDRFFGGDKRTYWTFGEQSGEWLSKNGPYVAQFQRGDFKRFWSILPAFWKTFYSEGEARISTPTADGEAFELEIDAPVQHVYFEYSVIGFVKRGLEVLGARVRVERIKGFSSGDSKIHYRFRISA